MKETSAAKATRRDIILIRDTLADMTFDEFINLPISKIWHLANLFETSKSDDQFAAVFARYEVRENRMYVCSPRKCEQTKAIMQGEEAYVDWCCAKLRLRIQNCMFKVQQMLEGANFFETKQSDESLQVYQALYDVISDKGKSLKDLQIAHAEAQLGKE